MHIIIVKGVNNNLVKEFGCKYDCIRELKMSDKTLHKSLQKFHIIIIIIMK
jgi:hypothetical protein